MLNIYFSLFFSSKNTSNYLFSDPEKKLYLKVWVEDVPPQCLAGIGVGNIKERNQKENSLSFNFSLFFYVILNSTFHPEKEAGFNLFFLSVTALCFPGPPVRKV